MKIEMLPKQELLLAAGSISKPIDCLVYGGARGGGKTYGMAGLKMACDIIEDYSSEEMSNKRLNKDTFRTKKMANNKNRYYKFLIDYPDYRGCIVRRTESALLSSTKTETDKIYPLFGGKWKAGEMKYVFPSGAEIHFRMAKNDTEVDYFQGQNFQRLLIEEVTQFPIDHIEKIESGCRSTHKYIWAMKLYTTNPGGISHKYIKKRFIDVCKAKPDGDPVYLEDFQMSYQPLKPGKIHVTKEGERYLFIPSLVFDNKHLLEKDKAYIRNLMNKNEVLKQMWLFGNWDVFAGQFFDMWDESVHVIDEYAFYGAKSKEDLYKKKLSFDWSNYRLYRAFDYGYGAPWACAAFAVDNDTNDVFVFDELVETKLTGSQQAEITVKYFKEHYNLTNDNFEMNIADPKSFWQNKDRGDGFRTVKDDYEDFGIILTPGINLREQGAMATLEALRVRENGTPKLRFLSCCTYGIETFPLLPTDEKNLNDVDTHAEDHMYDAVRYFLMTVIGEMSKYLDKGKKFISWRDKIGKKVKDGETYGDRPTSWKVA